MAVVNIRRDVDDKFYRYRMPLLQIKIEGRGNGIKTVIPNMSDIARALSRPPTYPTKFFGCELGAQVTCDDKTDRYIVNGAHNADALRKLLDDFIAKFVLCGSCKNPETDLKIMKDGMILRDCKACGKRSDVDMRHKLTTYIVKNPPPKKVKGQKGAGKAAGQSVEEADGGGSDDELTAKIQAEAKDIPTAEQRAKQLGAEGDDDVEWSVDTSEAAVKARVQQLEGSLQSSLILNNDDDEEPEDSPYSEFGRWLLSSREDGGEGPTAAEVYRKAQDLGIEKKHKAVQFLVQGVLTDDWTKDVKRYGPVIAKMGSQGEKHQKSLLGGLERFLGVHKPELIPATSKILMALYQTDAFCDEEALVDWGAHVSKKYTGDKEASKKVRKAAAPFLTWLKEAESEDEDDETKPKAKAGSNGAAKKAAQKEEDDDDSDLDNL